MPVDEPIDSDARSAGLCAADDSNETLAARVWLLVSSPASDAGQGSEAWSRHPVCRPTRSPGPLVAAGSLAVAVWLLLLSSVLCWHCS